jgi:hypothetical protein
MTIMQNEADADLRTQASAANPIIGSSPFDTMENAAAAVAAATLFDEGDDVGQPSDQVVAGRHFLLRCIGSALEWEVSHRN